ncbi:hypothetical protein JW906_08670 [bacterium]|nr:hypothetical protein [bacterium]
MRERQVLCACFLILAVLMTPLRGQERSGAQRGFVDNDGNGVNDWFADANGDGVNDVDGKPYDHDFTFRDEDGDGLNDLWQDADGDGVNDLLHSQAASARVWRDADGDGLADNPVFKWNARNWKIHVLDSDGDGKNDITGESLKSGNAWGYRHGRVDEEGGILRDDFMDADGDGLDDRSDFSGRGKGMDHFIDRDGDGIADDRAKGRSQAGRTKGGKGK